MFNKLEYYRKRYREDAVFRRKMIDAVSKYNKSDKGKEKKKVYNADYQAKNPDYHKEYAAIRREKARIEGKCLRCYKNKTIEKRKVCESCRNKEIIRYNKIKEMQNAKANI